MTRFTVDSAGVAEETDELTPTRHGFRFGGALVEALASFRGTTITRITPDVGSFIEIYVSPTGRSARVFRNGKELK